MYPRDSTVVPPVLGKAWFDYFRYLPRLAATRQAKCRHHARLETAKLAKPCHCGVPIESSRASCRGISRDAAWPVETLVADSTEETAIISERSPEIPYDPLIELSSLPSSYLLSPRRRPRISPDSKDDGWCVCLCVCVCAVDKIFYLCGRRMASI